MQRASRPLLIEVYPKVPRAPKAETVKRRSTRRYAFQKSYRFQGETGIAALARAINSGDSQGAIEALDRYDDVLLVPPSSTGRLSAVLREATLAGYGPYLQPGEAGDRLAKFDRFRILCARRTGPFGVEAVGEQVVVALRRAGLVPSGVENYDGRPIMITANTYELQIFNGDIGLVLPDPQSGQLRACFTGVGIFECSLSAQKFARSVWPCSVITDSG